MVAGTPTVPGLPTVTFRVAGGTFWAVAVIVVNPADTPVTGTVTEVVFAGMETVELTVATPGLLELRLTCRPPCGAGPESERVAFWVL